MPGDPLPVLAAGGQLERRQILLERQVPELELALAGLTMSPL